MGIEMPSDNILCKKCKYRLPNIKINDFLTIYGYKKGECEKYSNKPNGILFKNENCKYYEV